VIKHIIIGCLLLTVSVGGYVANTAIDGLKKTIVLMKVKHKKDILKTKLKERGKRLVAAVPVAGIIAVSWFEKSEYDEWKLENPEGTPEQYSKELKDAAFEMVGEYCHYDGSICNTIRRAVNHQFYNSTD